MARDEGAGAGSSAGVPSRRGERRGGGAALRAGQRPRDARVPRREGHAKAASGAADAAPKRAARSQPGARDPDHRHRARPRGLPAGADAGERVSTWTSLPGRHRRGDAHDGNLQIGSDRRRRPVARRIERLVDRVERELQPAFAHVNSIGRDAARGLPGRRPSRTRRSSAWPAGSTGRDDGGDGPEQPGCACAGK